MATVQAVKSITLGTTEKKKLGAAISHCRNWRYDKSRQQVTLRVTIIGHARI